MEVLYCAVIHLQPAFFTHLHAQDAFEEKGGGDVRKTRAMKAARSGISALTRARIDSDSLSN